MLAFALSPALLALTLSRHAGDSHRPGRGATAAEAKTRELAAAWVAAQVSRTATVSCDPAMCRPLEADRIPVSDLLG